MGPLSELALYANTQFEKYIPENSLQYAISKVHPVQNNLNHVEKMVGFLKDLLMKKCENNSLAID